jgi:formylglycine-generating enzyme required for sulfatase activity
MDIDAVSRPSPPYEDPAHGMGGPDLPATGMTQLATLRYARWLSRKTGRLFRLPTEAEWEYACRSGRAAGPGDLDASAWYEGNSAETTHSVGGKQANPWGLFDMLGNAAEWTLDEYRADFYSELEDGVKAPRAIPESTHPRTVRGGAFDDEASELRCSARLESTLRWKRRDPQIPKSVWWNTDSPHVGFRLVSPAGTQTFAEIEAYWRETLGSER